MNEKSFESGMWNKSAEFSLAPETNEEQTQMIVLPLPADARPEGIVHVGGVSGIGAC